jgi:sulfur carrier protein
MAWTLGRADGGWPHATMGDVMRVLLRNPRRELDLAGPLNVANLLEKLDLNRESVLVVRGGTLVPGDAVLGDDEIVEIRPVISGGQS